jgi:hypothetical protein
MVIQHYAGYSKVAGKKRSDQMTRIDQGQQEIWQESKKTKPGDQV